MDLRLRSAAILVVLVAAGPALAEEVEVVTIGADGVINRTFPIPKPFTLRGTVASNVTSVQAVFVRYARPALAFAPDGENCTTVRASILDAVKNEPSILESRNDATIAGYVAHLPPRWLAPSGPPPDKPREYSTLVAPRSFFLPNGHFCLFVFERLAITHAEAFSVRELIASYPAALNRQCGGYEMRDKLPECVNKVVAETASVALAAFDQIDTAKLSEKVRRGARNELGDFLKTQLSPRGSDLFLAQARLATLIESWNSAWKARAEVSAHASDFIKQLLVVTNFLVRSNSGIIRFPESDAVVEQIEPTADLTQLVVSYRLGDKTRQMHFRTPTTSIRLPGLSVTLYDVLALSTGRAAVDGVLRRLEEIPLHELTAARAPLQRVSELFVAAGDAIDRMRRCYGQQPCETAADVTGAPAEGPVSRTAEDEMILKLRGWLVSRQLQDCSTLKATAFETPCQDRASFWPGYPTVTAEGTAVGTGDPLRQFVDALDAVESARAGLSALPSEVSYKVETLAWEANRIELALSAGLNRSSFVANFIPTFIGYATILGPDTHGVPYIGAQLYLWPNNPDEPMWMHGDDDLRRLAAIELGFGLGSDALGEDGRFTAPRVFVGLSFQFLPYLKASGGAAFMSARNTSVASDTTDIVARPYLGISGEINVFGFVYLLAADPSGSVGSLVPKRSGGS